MNDDDWDDSLECAFKRLSNRPFVYLDKQDSYQRNRSFSDRMLPFALQLVAQLSYILVSVEVATKEDDCKHATDITIKVTGGSIAFRCRTFKVTAREFTVRTRSRNGCETEWHKLSAGYGDFYLYCWANETEDGFTDWVLLDLKKIREHGLLKKMEFGGRNNDKTEWKKLHLHYLSSVNAILRRKGDHEKVSGQRNLLFTPR